jgi:hypothetical protein
MGILRRLLLGAALAVLGFGVTAQAQVSATGDLLEPIALFYSGDGGTTWSPLTGSAVGDPAPLTPPQYAVFAYNSGDGKWYPWTGVGGGGGDVASVTNSDGTVTITPTTGDVVVSLALNHSNNWTASQSNSVSWIAAAGADSTYLIPGGWSNSQTSHGSVYVKQTGTNEVTFSNDSSSTNVAVALKFLNADLKETTPIVGPSGYGAISASSSDHQPYWSANGDAASEVCTAANGACSAAGPSNTTISVGTATITANACNTVTTTTMTGLTTSMTATITPTSDLSAVTGWGPGSGGQLYFIAWPSSSNTLSWYVCNPTSADITPSSSTTWNVSAK